MEELQVAACWPVILNKSFEESEIHRLLARSHKVKVTDATGQGVVIFPLSSVAFMIVSLDQAVKEVQGQITTNPEIIRRIERLNQIHRRGYIIVVSAVMGNKEMQALTTLQNRFLGTKSRFIPAHSPKECVDCMLMIAKYKVNHRAPVNMGPNHMKRNVLIKHQNLHTIKVTCKPMVGIIQERMKKLRETTISDNIVLQVLSKAGLNNHECLVLQHGCKTLSAVSQASTEDLMECSLDQHTAEKVISFFEKDCIQI